MCQSFDISYEASLEHEDSTLFKERERESKGLYVQPTQICYIRTSKARKKEK